MAWLCGRFGHGTKKSENDTKCIRCAGDHEVFDCNKKNFHKSSNCLFYNNKFQKDYKTDYICYDIIDCESLKNRIFKVIANTEYPTKPVVRQNLVFNEKLIASI